MAFYPKGRCKVGELSVDKMPIMPEKLLLAPLVKTLPLSVKAIKSADLIILGPGSFLTSVIPPLLVRDITKAIKASSAHCVFIENLGAEDSPAGTLSLDEKLNWIKENIGCLPIDSVICHDETVTSKLVPIIHCDLCNGSGSQYHNKEKLLNALKLCISGIDKKQAISA
jgi:uncharacterized cofD-like protein